MQVQQQFLANLSEAEKANLEFDWSFWGRKNQIAPTYRVWSVWLILAGRGFGKTRAGAEWVRSLMCGSTPLSPGQIGHIALVAETAADARDVMVGDGKGPDEASGLLQVHQKDFMPLYEPSKRRLTWPNGAIASIYNGNEPDQLRGPQHSAAWCDELCKWRYGQETYDQLQFGLRLGSNPQVLVSTTPKPIKLLKEIMADPGTVVTGGSTFENAGNLSPKFLEVVRRKYEGTRLGRQELAAEILEDVPGALWTRENIDKYRITLAKLPQMPQMTRIVVAIDPAVTSGEDADETGIIAVGLGTDQRGYVLEDGSGQYAPSAWAKEAIKIYWLKKADRVVAEVNNGGDMVESTLRMVDPNVAYKAVHASRGKVIRAEPVSALYEQGRVSHVGAFLDLEDQLCAFTSDYDRAKSGSPDRLDALVWALSELMVEEVAGWGIMEHYRRQSEKVTSSRIAAVIEKQPPTTANGGVRMQAPKGISTAYGMDGSQYNAGADGIMTVKPADVGPLRAAGFVAVAVSESTAA